MQNSYEFTDRDFFKEPFHRSEIEELLQGKPASEMFNFRSPSFKKLGLDKDNLTDNELDMFIDGFDGITIGRADGLHYIIIESYLFRDSVTFNSPVLGGKILVRGKIETTTADVQVILNGPSSGNGE